MANVIVYSELDQTGQHATVTNLDAIGQSVYNLLTTQKGTRLFLGYYGCNLEGILFEPNDLAARDMLFKEITDNVIFWEGKRLQLNPGQSSVIRYPDTHGFYVNLVFNVSGLANTQYNYSFGITP